MDWSFTRRWEAECPGVTNFHVSLQVDQNHTHDVISSNRFPYNYSSERFQKSSVSLAFDVAKSTSPFSPSVFPHTISPLTYP